jgi:two-component system KDP operon response regulator KdpE
MSKPANTVLVIDDEPQIRRFIEAGLSFHGYRVHGADTAATGLAAAKHIQPDVIVLDLGLPDANGIEVLETIRSWSNVPIIVLSIQADEDIKVLLLKSGADDYIVKPFGIAELAARCAAALRRYHTSVDRSPLVRTGRLAIDLASRSVLLDGQPITLTPREYRLLSLLASQLGLALTHNRLTQEIWGNTEPDNIQYLRMLVRRLRQKLEDDPSQPKLLISESGVGYRLEQMAPSTGSPR